MDKRPIVSSPSDLRRGCDFCSEVMPKPHYKQHASSPFQLTSILSTMSNQPKDSSLSSLESAVFARIHSLRLQSVNGSTGAAPSASAPPVLETPSSATRAADVGMAVAGEIPDNPFTPELNIDPHLITL